MHAKTSKAVSYVLLAAIVAVAAAVRLPHLGAASLWWDEFITLGVARLPLDRLLLQLSSASPSDTGIELFPPLYHLAVHALLKLSSDDATLRLLSVASGTATVAALYLLVKESFNARTGIYAAALCSLSLYHIHYSRELRPYSLFLLLSLASLLFVQRALASGRTSSWAAWSVSAALLLYSSYAALPVLTAQCAYGALVLAAAMRRGEYGTGAVLRRAGMMCLALAVAALAYAPWVDSHAMIYAIMKTGEGHAQLSWAFARDALLEFATYAAPRRGMPWLGLGALTLAGVLAGLGPRRRLAFSLYLLWAVVPVAAFLASGTSLSLSSRYFFSAYFLLLVCAALGADIAVNSALRLLRAREDSFGALRTACGLFLCLAVSMPGILALGDYYRRETSYTKELADYLAWNKNNAPYLLLESNRNLKLILGWYLPDVFKPLDRFQASGYKRAYLVGSSRIPSEQAPLSLIPKRQFLEQSVYALGVVNVSPVALVPDASGRAVFDTGFASLLMYAECVQADNLAPDLPLGVLSHYDFSREGSVAYGFTVPGGSLLNGNLEVGLRRRGPVHLPSDSKITVSARRGHEPFTVLAVLDDASAGLAGPGKSAHPASRKVTLPIGQALRGAGDFTIRIHYGPVSKQALVEVESLSLMADVAAPDKPDAGTAAQAENLARNNTLAPWDPSVRLINSDALYAFMAGGGEPFPGCNGNLALKSFKAAYPDASPVYTIRHDDGSPAVFVYDPALADPFVTLEPGQQTLCASGMDKPWTVKAASLKGGMNRPTLSIGGQAFHVPVKAPPGTRLLLNAGGEGVLRLEPVFQGKDMPDVFESSRNVVKKTEEDCLTCLNDNGCEATVLLASDFPVKKLRIAYYPRIFADKPGLNRVRLSVSADGGPYTPLDTLTSNGSGYWEGLMMRRVAVYEPPRGAKELRVRIEMSGTGAQLWSTPNERMRVEAVMDAAGFNAFSVPGGTFSLALDSGSKIPIGVQLLPEPGPYLHRLQDDH